MGFPYIRAGKICQSQKIQTWSWLTFGRGFKLGDRITKVLSPEQLKEIDVVMPIPETSITSAPCCAARLGKPYCQGFVKNRYVFRTFIVSPNGSQLRWKNIRSHVDIDAWAESKGEKRSTVCTFVLLIPQLLPALED